MKVLTIQSKSPESKAWRVISHFKSEKEIGEVIDDAYQVLLEWTARAADREGAFLNWEFRLAVVEA